MVRKARDIFVKLLIGSILIFLFSASHAIASEGHYSLEFSLGNAWNSDQTLTVKQDGYADISFDAEFDTRAFERPLYYALRFGRWKANRAWEFELIHHKLYVDDTPAEIEKFEITHGFNFLTINRAWDIRNVIYRVGLGTMLSHPDITVRGQSDYDANLPGGYQLGGIALQGAIQKRFFVTRNTFLSIEAKLAYADTTVPIANGDVDVTNQSFHLLFGYGGNF
jgi:hypothetical protein